MTKKPTKKIHITGQKEVWEMKIHHDPVFDTNKIEDFYSKKDGVSIKYVCTTSTDHDIAYGDVFYRSTPHPEFGNKYFRLIKDSLAGSLFIGNADWVENLTFSMISKNNELRYSRGRHDYVDLGDNLFIDGGRSYVRHNSISKPISLKIKNGQFIKV